MFGFLKQRRIDGSVNFARSWSDYVEGFGDLNGEFWLGLEKIHRLTQNGVEIFFNMTALDNTIKYAHYKVFTVHTAATKYRMNVDAFGYSGNIGEKLSFHDNMMFSTIDRDNDAHTTADCSEVHGGGGWWYNNCYRLGNLNGVYGIHEPTKISYYENTYTYIKEAEIRIKPVAGSCG